MKGSKPGSYRYLSEWENERSIKWIDHSYKCGATEVVAVEFARNAGYEAATILIVTLAEDSAARAKVFAFLDEQTRADGLDPEGDYGQAKVFKWFD